LSIGIFPSDQLDYTTFMPFLYLTTLAYSCNLLKYLYLLALPLKYHLIWLDAWFWLFWCSISYFTCNWHISENRSMEVRMTCQNIRFDVERWLIVIVYQNTSVRMMVASISICFTFQISQSLFTLQLLPLLMVWIL